MNHFRDHFLKIVTLGACLTACGMEPTKSESQLASIIDQNTMVIIDKDTQLSPQVRDNFAAIGKMTGGCTAFHLGHGIVATAGHCLEQTKQNSCHSFDIVWGQTLEQRNPEHSRCLEVLAYRFDQQVDYALLLVDPAPRTAVEIQHELREFNQSTGAMVLGYPKDKTLSWSGNCMANWNVATENQFFKHRCDTLPGSSGSPVLDAQSLKVLGIHNGDADNQENYGSFLPTAEEIMKLVQQVDGSIVAKPKQLSYGPFDNRLSKNLVNFSSKQAATVSFDLAYDFENGYDKLLLIDGLGRQLELTGVHKARYEHLATPVSLTVITDYSGNSSAVALSSISYE